MNPGKYHTILPAGQCAVKTHKSESNDIVKRSRGQNSTREQSSCGLSVSHPNVCSDRATRQTSHWTEARAVGGHNPSCCRWVVALTERKALTQSFHKGTVSTENLKQLSLVPEKVASPEVTWAIPSAVLMGLHQRLAFWCQSANRTNSLWLSSRRNAVFWCLGALF